MRESQMRDQSFWTLQTRPILRRYCSIAVKRSRSNWRVSYWFWVIPMNTVLQHRRVTDPCFRCALEKTSGRLRREYSRPVPRLLRGLRPRARCARFAACVLSALSLPCETPVQPTRLAADLLRPCSPRLYEMQKNEIPTSAPGDRALTVLPPPKSPLRSR